MKRTAKQFLIECWDALRVAIAFSIQLIKRHPWITAITTILTISSVVSVLVFASVTANRALAEERAFWTRAGRLTLEQRTMIKNDMVRTGRVPHLLPWWEMDSNHCSAVAWKLVNLLTDVKLVHGQNGSAWMLRQQNPGRLQTIWDASSKFDAEGRTNEEIPGTVMAEFKQLLDNDERMKPNGVYLIGFRFARTLSASKIKRDQADINSHVVVMTNSVMFHMFRYGNDEDPIVADLQEHFFSYNKGMQPVWVAEVIRPDGRPFRFPNISTRSPMEQKIYPWKDLWWILAIPDFSRGVNAFERALLYWSGDEYNMYPRLP